MRSVLPVLMVSSALLFLSTNLTAQYVPVPISSFTQDVVAETGNSSLTTTTMALDGTTVSNKVMYTVGFRNSNALGGGGLPDNGTITSGTDVYQLASYAAPNALVIARSQTDNMVLTTPASYSSLRLLGFSTEGTSLINATLHFTDGSSTQALTNYSVSDWFNATANLVTQGYGRVTRATPATGADAYPNNPRLYYININLNCADKIKVLQRISLSNITTAGNNAPFPNAVFLALSARAASYNVSPALTNATCSATGSASLTITGSAGPYTVSWNTVPVQTGLTATNLTAGNYIASITDAGGCLSTYPVTITQVNNVTISSQANTAICPGATFTPAITSNGATYSWSPVTGVSNPAILNPVLSPQSTTTYTVTATLGACTATTSFIVNVNTPVNLTVHADTVICNGAGFAANTVGNATTYSWSPATGVSDPSIANPQLSPATTTTYTVTAITGTCSVSKAFTVSVVPGVAVDAGNAVNIIEGNSTTLQGSGGAGAYNWSPATGLSNATILTPVATPAATTTYTLTITTTAGCHASDDVTITVIPYCIKVMEAITPNGDGINDRWLVTNGACTGSVRAKVFNRYGNLVYESANYQNDWQGTYKGKPVPDGTYYFVLEFTLLDGKRVPLNGNVTILR
ncbi:MAG: gliding motility-associated C-terminal domain-containing protein [Rhizobacter sp.]|nr:gliding motility-associated C-terminal domain-containing protein [Ferruginibacter sp.]